MASTRAEIESGLRYGMRSIEEDGLVHHASWFVFVGGNAGYYRYCTARRDYELLLTTRVTKEKRAWNYDETVDKPATCIACLTLEVE